jgi:hypothetical protein
MYLQLDTCRHLEWLNSVKKSYGSVEITSLSQAQAINEKGIYQVGNLKKTTFLKNPVSEWLNMGIPKLIIISDVIISKFYHHWSL